MFHCLLWRRVSLPKRTGLRVQQPRDTGQVSGPTRASVPSSDKRKTNVGRWREGPGSGRAVGAGLTRGNSAGRGWQSPSRHPVRGPALSGGSPPGVRAGTCLRGRDPRGRPQGRPVLPSRPLCSRYRARGGGRSQPAAGGDPPLRPHALTGQGRGERRLAAGGEHVPGTRGGHAAT